jgi:predicted dehydrogenase
MSAGHTLRVGLVGAGAEAGWGKAAHVPAIAAAPGVRLHAVATSNQASADASAAANDAALGFGNWREMVEHPEVDIVSVSVRAPLHAEIVEGALHAGKPVYCEWPLGRSLDETERLSKLARTLAVPTAIGLQGRVSPWLISLRDHLAEGVIGKIAAVTLVTQDELSTGTIAASNAYMLDAENGANPFTIHAGHGLDALAMLLGEPAAVAAVTTTSRTQVAVKEDGRILAATSPDQIAMSARFPGDVAASFQVRGGPAYDRSVLFEIVGDDALLRVLCDGYLHWRPLRFMRISAGGETRELAGPDMAKDPFSQLDPAPAANVGRNYQAFAERLAGGTSGAPDFADAAVRHRALFNALPGHARNKAP